MKDPRKISKLTTRGCVESPKKFSRFMTLKVVTVVMVVVRVVVVTIVVVVEVVVAMVVVLRVFVVMVVVVAVVVVVMVVVLVMVVTFFYASSSFDYGGSCVCVGDFKPPPTTLHNHPLKGVRIVLMTHTGNLDACTRQLTGQRSRSTRGYHELSRKVPYCAVCVVNEALIVPDAWYLVESPLLPFAHSNNPKYNWTALTISNLS